MFLRSLTLKGFKSFAEPTTLEFEPGVTVVVGPNGSGKSNLVDAVAWVLGAQSARSLRSATMDDVIFAGNGNRPPSGRAEVTLTIDNTAGLLPIEFTEVTITRTLFRSSGESEYAINGVPCRLLDVQELLSDSGVGRTQHVIVSQGQLDAVLTARPEDRRTVIEEAAGILKYRRRKEKAQRRLEATEANLVRLGDTLREVRRQLKPLERQADAARRHDDLAAELRALRLYVAGRQIAELRAAQDSASGAQARFADEEVGLRTRLRALDDDVAAAEAAAARLDPVALGTVVGRLEAVRQRARGVLGVLRERARSLERDRARGDRALASALEAEAATVSAELARAEEEAAGLLPQADRLAAAEADLARERAAFEQRWGQDVVRAGGRPAEVRAELGILRESHHRDRTELAGIERRLNGLEQRADDLTTEADRLRREIEQADAAEQPLVAAMDEADQRRTELQARVNEGEARVRAALDEAQRWAARAEALGQALSEWGQTDGADRLDGITGVVGSLVALLDIDAGWETAIEAALGEAVAAVVVDDGGAARAALQRFADTGVPGSVLSLDAGRAPRVGGDIPGGEAVRSHVRSPRPDVDALLDALLTNAVAVDGEWTAALDIAVAHPDAVVVTRRGDRFSGGGWRTGPTGVRATAAALDDARQRAQAAAVEADAAGRRLALARSELEAHAASIAELDAALDANDQRLTAAADALAKLEGARRDVTTEDDVVRAHLTELAERVGREELRIGELEAALPALEADEAAGEERLAAVQASQRALEERVVAVSALRTDLEVRAAGLEERRTFLRRRLGEIDAALATAAPAEAEGDSDGADAAVAVARLSASVQARLLELEQTIAAASERHRRESEAAAEVSARLQHLRRDRAEAERALEETRERGRRAELDEAEVRMRLEAAVDVVRRELDCEPDDAVAAPCPELADGTSPSSRVRELERELRLMGPVNPLALEEFAALSERHAFLEGQLEDVRSSRRELAKVIRAIDTEIIEIFGAAYADVADNFAKLFETLFPGGQGRLRLTDPDHPLDTGIEVEARPSGKNVRKLSLLSGGERSLTALAFLFAVFRSRPSPFYLLDEVEAALDDVNLHRFLELLDEFRQEAQLLVVSHQKRTMEAGDCLYGVSVPPGGSSRVISQRVAASA